MAKYGSIAARPDLRHNMSMISESLLRHRGSTPLLVRLLAWAMRG